MYLGVRMFVEEDFFVLIEEAGGILHSLGIHIYASLCGKVFS